MSEEENKVNQTTGCEVPVECPSELMKEGPGVLPIKVPSDLPKEEPGKLSKEKPGDLPGDESGDESALPQEEPGDPPQEEDLQREKEPVDWHDKESVDLHKEPVDLLDEEPVDSHEKEPVDMHDDKPVDLHKEKAGQVNEGFKEKLEEEQRAGLGPNIIEYPSRDLIDNSAAEMTSKYNLRKRKCDAGASGSKCHRAERSEEDVKDENIYDVIVIEDSDESD